MPNPIEFWLGRWDVTSPEGEFVDGAVRFQGTVVRDGRELLDRTTLTLQDDGSVRQLIEASDDGGETWTPTFDGIYRRT